jgi:hypothetical protein
MVPARLEDAMTSQITIEDLGTLAGQLEADAAAEGNRLTRLIRAYARIVFQRQPDAFTPRAVEHSDEDGHWDNSYPPKIRYKDRSGPRTIVVVTHEYDTVATSGGFYYDWRAVTTERGLCVDRDGDFYDATHEGTGSLGQFAAHPGDCNVMVAIEFHTVDTREIALDRLQLAEKTLREKAFPFVAALQARTAAAPAADSHDAWRQL